MLQVYMGIYIVSIKNIRIVSAFKYLPFVLQNVDPDLPPLAFHCIHLDNERM